ncbi:thiolase family protein [Aeromicrobium sp.]|uniref:thiolase family protein n=1 Tax=Aeromicrobium sp. TaxID=1871063 RepID=UPI00198E43B5|nr:thiolase family protein [Aeromicrobium sp.]MBC7632252.1 thiolase family protein [Aeromicrobium sp.]
MTAQEAVAIIGVGMVPFGRHAPSYSGLAMGADAARRALSDAGVAWSDVGYAVGGSKESGKPDSMVSSLGLTGVPFVSVRNGCATGGAALATAANAIRAGETDIALAVGFDKHPRGAFASKPEEYGFGDWYAQTGLMVTPQYFGMKARRYLDVHALKDDLLAQLAAKSFAYGAANPDAWRRKVLSEQEILSSRVIDAPLTQYMLCSPSEGAAAVVLARADRAADLCGRPVMLAAVTKRTRQLGSFEVFSPWLSPCAGQASPSIDAAAAAFARAGVTPSDVGVAQLQDTDAGAEIIHLAETGLCEHGEQQSLLDRGELGLNGRIPVNTDGGCLANGEPVGASGLRQVHEVVLQLQGRAGDRQVPGGPRVGLTHVYGTPGTSACTVLTV